MLGLLLTILSIEFCIIFWTISCSDAFLLFSTTSGSSPKDGGVEVLEPRRLEVISRRDEQGSNRRRAVVSLDRVIGTTNSESPNVVEVGTLRQG